MMHNTIGVRKMSSSVPLAATPEPITMTPIGFVENNIDEPVYIEWKKITSELVLFDQHLEALQSLSDYSHVMILFWMDQACYTKNTHVPQGKHDEVPEVGMFACRCPYRPNPIACTTVPLLGISGNRLSVQGLDAVNHSPILDIKPYTPQYDFVCEVNDEARRMICTNVRLPEWVFKLTY